MNPEHGKLIPPRVVIDEQACIGCMLCIQACPVDAIVGTSKLMHTIIESECTGCELCLPPCPVDCIDVIETQAGDGLPVHKPHSTPVAPGEQACIRCGDCIEACPEGLEPQVLHLLISNGEIQLAGKHGLAECTECGDCDPVCPSHISLLEWIRRGKQAQEYFEKENAATRLARRRFFDRNARLQRLEMERTERMLQRKQALKDKAAQQERIRASIARAQQKNP
jgi:Na+-translocating ferredoxin:NAD+ oxidoreductase RnfC subunit